MVVLEAAGIIGVVGWVAAPVLSRLIGKVRSYMVKEYKGHKSLQEKLETLVDFLEEMGSTVSLVEARRMNNKSMECWLSQLKGAIDEVDDILDHLDYEILKSANNNNLPGGDDPNAGQSSRRTDGASTGSAESLNKKLKRLLNKLEDIRQSSRGLVQASMLAVTAGCSSDGTCTSSRPVTGPLLPSEMEPVGYDDQFNDLRRWLVSDQEKLDDDRSVIAIIGHGGMGKTTLAQRACNDPQVKKRFDLVIWASVYNKFSEADLLGEIWRSAATARHSEVSFSFSSIQQALEKLVASKQRYLLVLDDVCNDEAATELRRRETWSHVLAPFFRFRRGSRVLLTTRAEICAHMMGADGKRRMVLTGIDRDSFIRLLKTTAGVEARDLHEALRSSPLLSEESKSPWPRSPLSAKEMGIKLRNTCHNKNKWAEILATDCHENAISTHVSSYKQLPPHLQYCLAFLSLFPNNFRFQREMLVKMWVAHGFVNDDDGRLECGSGSTMEDTAGGYFDDLLSRSFLQNIQADYAVHEHIHSMIRSVSANHFLMIHGNCAPSNIPPTVRHLSVLTSCLACLAQLKKHAILKRLRTFLVPRYSSIIAAATPCAHEKKKDSSGSLISIDKDLVLTELLRELAHSVRVLDLTGTDIAALPPEIGSLIHLRYLALPHTLRMLPKEFGKLFHLQTLIGSNNGAKTPEVRELAFIFCANMEAASLELLAGMNSLRGSLSITGLDAVASKEDAQKAQLRKKKSVKVLKFEWDDGLTPPGSDVLEGLEPPIGIKRLQIRRYQGISIPTWLANNSLEQLTHLYIINCRKWQVLPPFGHLPHLNHLHIQEMELVHKIDGSGPFKSLETLVLSDMPNLAEWTAERAHSGSLILKRIEIRDCPILVTPPPFPPTLELIKVRSCFQLQTILQRENVYQAKLDLIPSVYF